uniref:Uncharacterized protein n=1 Tax=Arundo donax TaxID=35708 RepID=A0A0A9FCU1_ARUDO
MAVPLGVFVGYAETISTSVGQVFFLNWCYL